MGIKKIAKDLLGQRFGKLVVIEGASSQNGHAMWKCICDCSRGNTVVVRGSRLISGHTTTCGCHRGINLPCIKDKLPNSIPLGCVVVTQELSMGKLNNERNELYDYLISLAPELDIQRGNVLGAI